MAIGSALSVGLIGLKAFIVQIQAFVSPGLPYFSIIGLPDTSLSEARERVKSACQASGFKWPETRVTVNLSPASMPKKGSSHDLAIAASVLSAAGAIAHDCLAGTIVLGEVNLDGTVLPINGLLPIMLHAREQGIATIIVPYANLDEARLVPDVKAIGVRHVGELIELMGGDADYRIPEATHAVNADVGATGMCPPPGDMSEVMGQQAAKWALEVAAAGGHHLMMTGPPGTGKTMLASRIPGIMSPLNETEQLEVASIRSLCGTLPGYGISDVPPFEAPHHTASTAALVGGGAGLAQPGAITRAHRGILFMDEAPEFSARTLQTLREPLESGYVAISRAKGTTYYPARFQLIMAANPCPCGYYNHPTKECTCSPGSVHRYMGRISGPLMDRIDLHVEVTPVTPQELSAAAPGEASAAVRERVVRARAVQEARFGGVEGVHTNSMMNSAMLREYCRLDAASAALLERAMERLSLSARAYDRILKAARTIADLAGRADIVQADIAEAINYRSLDRGNWGR